MQNLNYVNSCKGKHKSSFPLFDVLFPLNQENDEIKKNTFSQRDIFIGKMCFDAMLRSSIIIEIVLGANNKTTKASWLTKSNEIVNALAKMNSTEVNRTKR